jgi:redox-sensing transcriptional repressor
MSELSPATVARLPRYLRLLEEFDNGRTVSSDVLAEATGVTAANVRRDLAALGFQGTRGVGYSAADLANRIRRELGIDKRRKVGIVGAGNLGTALAGYSGLARRGFDVTAVYDVDPRRIGQRVGGVEIRDMAGVAADSTDGLFDMAVLAVPAPSAQTVADQLVAAGIKSILNFAPARIEVPDGVALRQVDLSYELQVLSYYG